MPPGENYYMGGDRLAMSILYLTILYYR